ncbi:MULTISPECIES: DoxX family protein [unclassified Saccharicrinis]|uniref:DoxX family protein n=1 Tax=unclassified Saccharicrinis TaxID=2646859 RepID=UPI003D328FA4
MKKLKIVNWISTGLLTVMMLMSASMYFIKHADMVQTFEGFGYPSYIIYPLAIAKILGLLAIWFCRRNNVKEWAYAGFFFDFVLAFFAHYMTDDGKFIPALVALLLLATSYFSRKKLDNIS